MAAKIILSMEGVVLHEYPLNKARISIGRKPHNDVVIDNLAVSGEHAAIVTILNDSFLEDLDSTNGVVVNGVSIKKHFLQANDVIEIGKYKLKYMNGLATQPGAADFEKTMVLRAPLDKAQAGGHSVETSEAVVKPVTKTAAAAQAPPLDSTSRFTSAPPVVNVPPVQAGVQPTPATGAVPSSRQGVPPAALQVLSGGNAGRELDLVKNLTTLGKPGVQVAVLTRRPHGYFITHVEGVNKPSLNGKMLDEQPHQLNNHDIIELAGVKMEFYFKD